MKKLKIIITVVVTVIVTAMTPWLQMFANENFIISADDPRYKYLINDDGTISIAASEHDKTGLSGNVVLPSTLDDMTVSGILKHGFFGAEITSVTIPDTITSIGALAFGNCHALSEVTLNDNITYMGDLAFSNTEFETNLLENTDTGFAVLNDYILYLYTGNDTDVEVPDGIRLIANSAFANNGVFSSSEISNVTINDEVEYIGDYAFDNCESLTEITIGTGLKSVGTYAIDSNVTIRGYSGTYAEEFAAINGNTFILIVKNKDEFIYECDYDENFKQYYFSTDTEFSREGIHVYKRFYDGSREEITDWEFSSTPSELYAASAS